jgi:hypothetical protein
MNKLTKIALSALLGISLAGYLVKSGCRDNSSTPVISTNQSPVEISIPKEPSITLSNEIAKVNSNVKTNLPPIKQDYDAVYQMRTNTPFFPHISERKRVSESDLERFVKTAALPKLNAMFAKMHESGLLPKEISENNGPENVTYLVYNEMPNDGKTNAAFTLDKRMSFFWTEEEGKGYFKIMNIDKLPDGTLISGGALRNNREIDEMLPPRRDVPENVNQLLEQFFGVSVRDSYPSSSEFQSARYGSMTVNRQVWKPRNQPLSIQAGAVSLSTTTYSNNCWLTDVRASPGPKKAYKETQIDERTKVYSQSPKKTRFFFKQ